MNKKTNRYILTAIMLTMMTWGCAPSSTPPSASATQPGTQQQQVANSYTGKILGKSDKAKTISLEVGQGDQAKTLMVKFDNRTTGLEHAETGEAAIVSWEMRGDEKFATVIKPKLAKLPPGVAEIKPVEVKELIDDNTDFLLIDSRPEKPYAQSHLPGAVSLPIETMTAGGLDQLPKEKDKLLVFYCGGYT